MNNKPEVGMGATVHLGSDCYPYTIIDINKQGTRIMIQPDHYELIKGSTAHESQTYRYTPSIVATEHALRVSLRFNGHWRVVKAKTLVSIGHRRAYRDPCF